MNKIILMGRLTRDPERKVSSGGVEYCTFSVATNRRFKNPQTGEREADFIPCKAWRQQCAFICNYFHQGDMIALEGTMQSRRWQDDEGKTHYGYEAQVENVEFCGGKRQEGQAPAPQSAPPPAMDGADDELPF